ncbi:restriction endonuclease subunit S [Vibrio sp. Isolate31]|uniref:restriction endonuclease subunit S n=1 Tax=unclassified Vibrio TaxID=2614977 RepID=UPI001EFCB7F3|nr:MULTISPECIES: restriction endonuclease subunit S [unclassified Vibrio]MCG9554473.1 restriction endonuclease subunit S [Vibrio sp. Isolate32]MCG9599934.1 restriction endonuclease subunit S [Vibrio sp. Isolate31]
MGNEWINTELGDVIELKRGYDLPKTKRINGSVPVVSSSGHSGLHNEVKIKSPGVVTGRYGTIGQVFYIEEDFWPLNTTLYVKDFKGNDPLFIYYYLKTVSYKDYTDKGAVPGVNRNDLHRAKVSVPKCPKYQNKLATHLRDLDKKITLNNQINQTLEQMAQAIFKSWFVDFDPVKAKMNGEQPKGMDAATASLFPEKFVESEVGLIPEGWNVRSLEEVAEFQNGFAFYTTGYSDKGFSVVDLGNISTEGKFIQTSHDKYVSEEIYNLPKHQKHHLNKDDLVMAMTDMTQAMGILGKTGIITESDKYILNQRVGRIRCKSNIDVNFMLTNLNSKHQLHFLKVRALGTVQKYVNTNHIKEMEFIIPCDDLMQNFGDLVRPLFDRLYANDLQSLELAKLRDTLLPKLLSGEIDLESVQVEQAKALAE